MVLELKFDSISELAELQRLAVQADKPVYIANEDDSIPLGPLGRFRPSGRRHRDARPQRGRVDPHRRDGRRLRAEHLVRVPGHGPDPPRHEESARHAPDDRES